MTRSDPPHTKTKALTRALLMALLGLLCLSNIFVHGQGTTAPPASTTTGSVSGTQTGSVSGTQPGTSTGSVSLPATGTASGSPTPTPSRSPMDPLSSLSMVQPKANVKNPPLFPLGVDLSFSWTYDQYLKLQPTNLTIQAIPSKDPKNVLTIANAIPGNLKNYTWPAAQQLNQTNPISTDWYTLRIFDGGVGLYGVLPQGGYLTTYSGLTFGLYRPSTYTPGAQMNPPLSGTYQFAPVPNSNAVKTVVSMATLAIVFMASVLLF